MARPTARVLAMLEVLESGGVHRVGALAERLGVDERTVRRYAEHLVALDIPIEALRGRYGGYRLAPGFRMPPLMLTEDEAVAIVLALATRSPAETGAAADSALAKVRRAMPAALSPRIDALLTTTAFTTTAGAERAIAEAPPTATLLSFAEAARGGHPVEFRYEDRTGRGSRRTVLPFGIVARSGRWYVTGSDSLSGEVRTFRLDRIASVRVLPDSFAVPDDVDPAAMVAAGLAAAPWRHEVSLRVTGELPLVASRIPAGIATVEPSEVSGDVRMRFRAEQLDWIPAMLVRLELPFLVERPAALRDLVADVAARLSAAAAESPSESAS
jgi:predicted DNA-binding transcriptional regulator YafY